MYMTTLKEVKAMRINTLAEHQRVIAKLLTHLGRMYHDLKEKNHFAYHSRGIRHR